MLTGTVKDGNILPDNPNYFKAQMMKLEGKRIQIEEVRRSKTQGQLGYLFGVCYPLIAEHTGYTIEETHSLMKKLYLPRKFIMWRGREIELEPSIKPSTSKELSEFITNVINEAGEMNINIPPPDELHDLKD